LDTIRTYASNNHDVEVAIRDITGQLHPTPELVLFFSSTVYSFEDVSKLLNDRYPSAQVVGLTTTGEIGPKGFQEFGLSAISFSQDFGHVRAILMDDIVKYPVFARQQLKTAAQEVGIQTSSKHPEKEGIGLVFPTGLIGAEEKMLSIVNSIFDEDGFPFFGGTAGDDAKFEATYVSVNNHISSVGGVVIFMKPALEFSVIKENIFTSTGNKMKITKVDTESRIVYEMDGQRAATVYAKKLGVREADLPNYFMSNPIGRRFNDEIFIASPFQIMSDGAIQFYCQVFLDSIVEILEPMDPVKTLEHTLQQLNSQFSKLDGVLACNCILRKLQFQNQQLFPALNRQLEQLPNLGGFCSYGEQINKSLINQTLVLLGFGEKGGR